jgi:hypothetical protein
MFYIYDIEKNTKHECKDKNDFLRRVYYVSLELIGHNVNDTYVVSNNYWKHINGKYFLITYRCKEKIRYILYEDDIVLNKYDTMKEALEYYNKYSKKRRKPAWYKKRVFKYRKEPVPYIHKYHTRWWRKIKKGKKEYVDMLEYPSFHKRRLSKKKELILSWGDDYPRPRQKSWKFCTKRKKQWKDIRVIV